MKKFLLTVLIIIMPITFCGCWDTRLYERLGFILTVALEPGENNTLNATYIIPFVQSDAKSVKTVISTSDNALNMRYIREDSRLKLPANVEAGKLQQILISKDLGEKGIHNILEIFEREPLIPQLAFVVIVDGSPRELIKTITNKSPIMKPSFYILQLLLNANKLAYTPETRVYNYDIAYYADGMDPISPLLKLEKSRAKAEGTALFSKDKYVGSIDTQKTLLLLSVMGKAKDSAYTIPGPKSNSETIPNAISISVNNPKNKISIEYNDNKPEVFISLKFNSALSEYKWNNLSDRNEKSKIEDYIANDMKNNCITLLKYTQSVNSDPIGIGDMFRAKYGSELKEKDLKALYKKVKFNVDVKVNLKNTGMID